MNPVARLPLFAIASETVTDEFPPVDTALRDPDGLLAAGGDVGPERLLEAYPRGIFPWYSDGSPILWWSPNPRCVLYPERFKLSRSLRKTLRSGRFRIDFDRDFAAVIDACAAPRRGQSGTWITSALRDAFIELHRRGFAHCVECRVDDQLVGGLYGLVVGKVFFGESMFSHTTDASKIALHALVEHARDAFELIDCQVHSAHLESLGAVTISRAEFVRVLDRACGPPDAAAPSAAAWRTKP